jgi:hypothetical protein
MARHRGKFVCTSASPPGQDATAAERHERRTCAPSRYAALADQQAGA